MAFETAPVRGASVPLLRRKARWSDLSPPVVTWPKGVAGLLPGWAHWWAWVASRNGPGPRQPKDTVLRGLCPVCSDLERVWPQL